MSSKTVRAIIAILIVGSFMIITGVMALLPLFDESTDMTLSGYMDYFSKIANVYTGITGVIIGYYFGQASNGKSEEKAEAKSG